MRGEGGWVGVGREEEEEGPCKANQDS